jgi:hypothetical protein
MCLAQNQQAVTDDHIRKSLKERFFIRPTTQIRGLGKGNMASLSELRIRVSNLSLFRWRD